MLLKKPYFLSVLFIVSLFFNISLSAQNVEIPNFTLSDISFHLHISELPDSINWLQTTIYSGGSKSTVNLTVTKGVVDTTLVLDKIGQANIKFNDFPKLNKEIRVIPGWFSIIPPLLAIFLALLIRQVIVSLSAGILIGAIFIYDYNPLTALLRFADTIILNSLIDKNHALILLFTFLMGGVVGVINKNGGMTGLANVITKFAKKARTGMLSSWFMGLVIFFDDYSNTLIVGSIMRPISDKLKISREKLAYIVDSTSAPVASLFIISTWIGFELGLIDEGLKAINSAQSAYDVFFQSIMYRFYPIATLFFVFIIAVTQRDFGPMLKAEKKARSGEKPTGIDEADVDSSLKEGFFYSGTKAKWFNAVIPILIILLGTIIGLYVTGIESLKSQGEYNPSLRLIISNSDSYSSLLWASLLAGIVAIIMSISQKILNLHESFNAWTKGIESMLFANLILVFAWSISSITGELKTADFIISVISSSLDPRFLPFIVFIICAITSFSTGTSWGTMAIVMPIVIPLSNKLALDAGLNPIEANSILYSVVGSVLAGSVFGDHCSPIADTTILSSLASGCNHVEHVRTQLPYALLIGLVSVILGDLLTAFGLHPIIAILLIFVVLYLVLRFKGVRVD